MPALIEVLAAELERPRELSPRVLNYISGTYSIDPDDIGRFLVDELVTAHWFDISTATRLLGYHPRISAEEGFERLSRWIRESTTELIS